MESAHIDKIFQNLTAVLPIIHKKLLVKDLDRTPFHLTRLHLAIMGMLRVEGLTASEITRKLLIPKSETTRLIDQLVKLDIVARRPDAEDRRVAHIALTEQGQVVLKECRELVIGNLANRLSSLTPQELSDLSAALEQIKNIGAKLP
jgi:DNA-binding MarR family transcriptional regulator